MQTGSLMKLLVWTSVHQRKCHHFATVQKMKDCALLMRLAIILIWDIKPVRPSPTLVVEEMTIISPTWRTVSEFVKKPTREEKGRHKFLPFPLEDQNLGRRYFKNFLLCHLVNNYCLNGSIWRITGYHWRTNHWRFIHRVFIDMSLFHLYLFYIQLIFRCELLFICCSNVYETELLLCIRYKRKYDSVLMVASPYFST